MNFKVISWEKLERDCISLARKIEKSGQDMDEIVSISRGGMVVSRILSDLLSLPVSHIAIQSYDEMTGKEPVLTQASSRVFNGEKILLIDELSDSGKTFHHAVKYLKSLPIQDIVSAAVYIKPHTTYIPHFFVENIDAWLILPYELRETKETFLKTFGEKEGKRKLRKLELLDWEKS